MKWKTRKTSPCVESTRMETDPFASSSFPTTKMGSYVQDSNQPIPASKLPIVN